MPHWKPRAKLLYRGKRTNRIRQSVRRRAAQGRPTAHRIRKTSNDDIQGREAG